MAQTDTGQDATKNAADEPFETIIERPNTRLSINFRELWNHRYLILLLVRRDFIALYVQTILGPLWFVISPLASVATFIVVFGHIVDIPTNGLPHGLFYLSGLVIWNYFTSNVAKTSDFLGGNAHLMSKVYFPRLVIPIATVISNVLPFVIQFALLVVVSVYYRWHGVNINFSPYIVLIPFLVGYVALLGLTFGIFISSLTAKYRDVSHLIGLVITILMYASPIIYPVSQIPIAWRPLYMLNPMATVIEIFRFCTFGSGDFDALSIARCLVITAIGLLIALFSFSRIEKNFVDTV